MSKLLEPNDPAPFEVINPEGRSPILFVSDHNGKAVPHGLDNLGVHQWEIERHIGHDIGIDMVARALSAHFDATLVVANYSRLVIDCNRRPRAEGSMPEVSDTTPIPGNRDLSDGARQARIDEIFTPYHQAISQRISVMQDRGVAPLLVALHSFTPTMDSLFRPWEIGILWLDDGRLAVPLMNALRRDPKLSIGDNEPYSGRHPAGYTVDHHAESRGMVNVAVEFRQDLVEDIDGAGHWAEIFAKGLGAAVTEYEKQEVAI